MFINWALQEINLKIVYYGPGMSGKTTNLEYIHSKLDPSLAGELVSLKTKEDRTIFFDFMQIEVGRINEGNRGWRTRTRRIGAVEIHQRVDLFDARQTPVVIAPKVLRVERGYETIDLVVVQLVVDIDIAIAVPVTGLGPHQTGVVVGDSAVAVVGVRHLDTVVLSVLPVVRRSGIGAGNRTAGVEALILVGVDDRECQRHDRRVVTTQIGSALEHIVDHVD